MHESGLSMPKLNWFWETCHEKWK